MDVRSATFASPRVGNQAFVSSFEATMPGYWRVVTQDDVVPLVPPGGGYTHARNGVKFMKDGQLGMLTAQEIDLAGLLPGVQPSIRRQVGACSVLLARKICARVQRLQCMAKHKAHSQMFVACHKHVVQGRPQNDAHMLLQVAEEIRAHQRQAQNVRLQRLAILVRELGNLVLRRPAFMQHRTPGFLSSYFRTVELVASHEAVHEDKQAQRTLQQIKEAEELLQSVS